MTEKTLDAHDRRIGENAKAVAYLKQELREIKDRLADIEQVVDTGMGAVSYEQMTPKDKVRQVRAYLVDQAKSGRPYMTYDQVISLFNGHPSPGHAYNLMKRAGNAEGFEYQTPSDDRPNRIVVDLADVNEDAAFHSVNNPTAEEAT